MTAEIKKKVAIVGGGPAGLVSLKECLAEGLDAEIIEARPEIGGQWAYQETPDSNGEFQSSIYAGVVLNSCRDTSSFTDFPINPAEHGDYFGHQKMLRYILDYADHFHLHKHIQLNTRVLSSTQSSDGQWTLEIQTAGHLPELRTYDAVFAASGHNSIPNIPDFKGREVFQGQFMHSHYYRRPGPFQGKRVALIGQGSTAVDIASELSISASEVHMITRRGGWVIPRYAFGKPIEALDSRMTQSWVPPSVSQAIQTILMDFIQGPHPKELKPKHKILEQAVTLRTEFLERIRTGFIKIHRTEVDHFTETGLALKDDTVLDVDVVICCTGFDPALPYLPADVMRNDQTPDSKVDMYKLVVPERYRNLFLIGYIESPGPGMPVFEAQARFVVGVLTGRVKIPEGEALSKEIRKWQAWQAKNYVTSDRHALIETYVPYIDGLLEQLGANPTYWRLWGQVFTSGHPLQAFKTLNAVYFGICSSAQWRLCGHGKKEELSRETVVRIAGEKQELSAREKELLI